MTASTSAAAMLVPKPLTIARTMPLEVGIIHFVGIGGIGMSGIAEILHNLGYTVQGSDIAPSANVERLQELGITVHIGHMESNVEEAAVIVVSSAIKEDNPEIKAARERRTPIVRRAEMLAELMRLKMSVAVAGTHGKTTTTALTASILEAADLQPTVINGGVINAYNSNAWLGKGDWMVVEADESDGTFTRLPATVAIVTNMDAEHLDHYGTFERIREAFHTFLMNIPFYGFGVMCIDHPNVQALISEIRDRRIITYGFSPQADIRAMNVRQVEGGQCFDIYVRAEDITISDVTLHMYGQYNISNALAAIAVAKTMQLPDTAIRSAMQSFSGVKRRFSKVGYISGITIIDDYAHHPVEIAATLKAARDAQEHTKGRVIAVVQPHRYSRLRDLLKEFCTCFNDANIVLVADVYEAGEVPIEGISAEALVAGLKEAGHKEALYLPSQDHLAPMITEMGKENDMVVCLGAGSITHWAKALEESMRHLQKA